MNAQNYGFIYNELVIDPSQNKLIKRTRRSLIDGASSKTATAIQQRKEGEAKLRKEIQFYMCIQCGDCRIPPPFVMPRVYTTSASASASASASPELHIQYFADYEPLTERFPYTAGADAATTTTVIREILDHLRPLHTHSPRIQITEEEYRLALQVEVYDKIVERYSSVDWKNIYPEFERLTHVNGIRVRSFMEYATMIRRRIKGVPPPNGGSFDRLEMVVAGVPPPNGGSFARLEMVVAGDTGVPPPNGGSFARLDMVVAGVPPPNGGSFARLEMVVAGDTGVPPPNGGFLTYIHGDTHLGNILVPKPGVCIDNDTPRYVFIDPRGYFASYDIFGDPHYDYAKLLFGISGYSRFDQMTIEVNDVNDVANDANGAPEMTDGISCKPEMNITIPFIDEYSSIYKSLDTPEWQSSVPELTAELTRLISLSIWLGNNSTFISPEKKLMSLMISRYLCERFL
jgi:hypothetical protein